MPNLKYSEQFFWLISKQDNSLTLGVLYTNDSWVRIPGYENDHSIVWVKTHFHMIPLVIPKDILGFKSPETNSGIVGIGGA